jgi:hypothetical protein
MINIVGPKRHVVLAPHTFVDIAESVVMYDACDVSHCGMWYTREERLAVVVRLVKTCDLVRAQPSTVYKHLLFRTYLSLARYIFIFCSW